VIALIVLLALPFFSVEGEKSWKAAPMRLLTILLIAVALGTFTNLASTHRGVQSWTLGPALRSPRIRERTHAASDQGALSSSQAVPQLPRLGEIAESEAGSRPVPFR